MKTATSRVRKNASAAAPAPQPANRQISVTLSPALSDALERFGKPAGCSIESVCEYWLFTSFHHPHCEDDDPKMNVPASALVSEGARRLASVHTHPEQRPTGAARAGGGHWSAKEPRGAAGIVPNCHEMELAISQAEGLIELLSERVVAENENTGRLEHGLAVGVIELSWKTCQRLRAAFHGRAA